MMAGQLAWSLVFRLAALTRDRYTTQNISGERLHWAWFKGRFPSTETTGGSGLSYNHWVAGSNPCSIRLSYWARILLALPAKKKS